MTDEPTHSASNTLIISESEVSITVLCHQLGSTRYTQQYESTTFRKAPLLSN